MTSSTSAFASCRADGEAPAAPQAEREAVITRLLALLADRDLGVLNGLLLEAAGIIAAEVEDEAYRLRNVRLAESGFLPLEEAVAIYQPLAPEDLQRLARRTAGGNARQDTTLPVPLSSAGLLGTESLFERALGRVSAEAEHDRLQQEFAALCNRLIAADQSPVRQRAELRAVVRKACGYLSIGLEQLLGPLAREDHAAAAGAADLLQRHFLEPLFRVGYGQAAALKRRAQRWQRESWFGERGLPLGFWGEEGLGLVGGLLLKRPLYFEGYRRGQLYRDFAAMAEIHETRRELDDLIWLDQLLSLLNPPLPRCERRFLTYKNLLLTLWACSCLGLPAAEKFPPLALADFRHFCEGLFTPRAPTAAPRSPAHPNRAPDGLSGLAGGGQRAAPGRDLGPPGKPPGGAFQRNRSGAGPGGAVGPRPALHRALPAGRRRNAVLTGRCKAPQPGRRPRSNRPCFTPPSELRLLG